MMTNQGGVSEKVEKRLRVMRRVWGYFLMAVVGPVVFIFVIGPEREPDEAGGEPTLFYVFLALGVMLVASSFVVKGLLLKRAANEGKLELVHTALVVALSLCEGAVLLAVVSHFVTGHPYSFGLLVLGVLGELAHFPRRDHLLAAAHKSRGT